MGSLLSVVSRRSTLSKPTSPVIELPPVQEESSGDGVIGDDGEDGTVDNSSKTTINNTKSIAAEGQGGFVGGSGDNDDIELGHT